MLIQNHGQQKIGKSPFNKPENPPSNKQNTHSKKPRVKSNPLSTFPINPRGGQANWVLSLSSLFLTDQLFKLCHLLLKEGIQLRLLMLYLCPKLALKLRQFTQLDQSLHSRYWRFARQAVGSVGLVYGPVHEPSGEVGCVQLWALQCASPTPGPDPVCCPFQPPWTRGSFAITVDLEFSFSKTSTGSVTPVFSPAVALAADLKFAHGSCCCNGSTCFLSAELFVEHNWTVRVAPTTFDGCLMLIFGSSSLSPRCLPMMLRWRSSEVLLPIVFSRKLHLFLKMSQPAAWAGLSSQSPPLLLRSMPWPPHMAWGLWERTAFVLVVGMSSSVSLQEYLLCMTCQAPHSIFAPHSCQSHDVLHCLFQDHDIRLTCTGKPTDLIHLRRCSSVDAFWFEIYPILAWVSLQLLLHAGRKSDMNHVCVWLACFHYTKLQVKPLTTPHFQNRLCNLICLIDVPIFATSITLMVSACNQWWDILKKMTHRMCNHLCPIFSSLITKNGKLGNTCGYRHQIKLVCFFMFCDWESPKLEHLSLWPGRVQHSKYKSVAASHVRQSTG